MDEQKVKEIYKELYEQFNKLEATIKLQEGNVSQKISDDLNEMEQLLTKLKEKAAKANIDVDGEEDIKYTENSNNDWIQLIDCSESDDKIKDVLKKHIISLGKFPSAKQALDMVDIIDRYYDANVAHPTGTRVNEVYEKIFGKPSDKEEAESKEIYQKAAYAGILKGIKSITNNWTINPDVHFHIPFVAFYKKEEALPEEVTEMNIPLQFKIDGVQKEWGMPQTFGFLKFTKPTIQLSFKFSYWKDAHLIRTSNEEIFGLPVESYSQAVRNTVTLNRVGKGLAPRASTTVYSKGLVIPITESINAILKTELGAINVLELSNKLKLNKDKSLSFSLGAVRLQFNCNLIKLEPEIHKQLKAKGVHLDRAIVSGAIGFNLSLDPLKLTDFVELKIKKKPRLDSKAKEVIKLDDDDLKKLKKLEDKADALENSAEKLGKLLKDQEPSKKDFKNAAKLFKENADDFYESAQEFMKKSKATQEAAEALLEEVAEKVTKKIGTKAMAAFAKMAGKAVPVVGAVITFVEVVTLAYDIYTYFNNSALPWEEQVAAWLRSW